jgi:hypothetical protein
MINLFLLFVCSHGEPWSRFRSKVSKALASPEAAKAAVPALQFNMYETSINLEFISTMLIVLFSNSDLVF